MLNFSDLVTRNGFAVVDDLVTSSLRARLASLFDDCGGRAGDRSGLEREEIRALVRSTAVRQTIEPILGERAYAIRATLFDKTIDANWLVPLHQDITIPLRRQREVEGFAAWSIKDDVPHVRPPVEILQSMLALRVELDGSDASSGALRVIPGSHTHGILEPEEIEGLRRGQPAVACDLVAGSALLMRPLLLHASSRAELPRRRRVIHIEFAAVDLPDGLEWHTRCS